MPEMLDDIAYLSQEVGPRPAGTEEEQQAALYIADQFQNRAGLSAEIEDFSCVVDPEIVRLLCFGLAAAFSIGAVITRALVLPAFIVSAVCAVLYVLEIMGKPMLSRVFERGASQNVVARLKPAGEASRARRRKLIIVANYDSGRVRAELKDPILRALPILQIACVAALVATPIVWMLRGLFFMGVTAGGLIFWNAISIIAIVLMALPVALYVLHRMAPYSEAANSNASGVATLIEVASRIASAQDAEADAAEYETTIHGENAARAAGLVPEGAQLEYDTPGAGLGNEDEGMTPEERLAAAKANIAALTGRPVREYAPRPTSVADNLVQARGAELDAPTHEEVAQVREEVREALGQGYVHAAQQAASTDVAAAAVAAPTAAAASSSDVPDWFKTAQAKANKASSHAGKPAARSRYADALDAAVSTSAGFFRKANQAVAAGTTIPPSAGMAQEHEALTAEPAVEAAAADSNATPARPSCAMPHESGPDAVDGDSGHTRPIEPVAAPEATTAMPPIDVTALREQVDAEAKTAEPPSVGDDPANRPSVRRRPARHAQERVIVEDDEDELSRPSWATQAQEASTGAAAAAVVERPRIVLPDVGESEYEPIVAAGKQRAPLAEAAAAEGAEEGASLEASRPDRSMLSGRIPRISAGQAVTAAAADDDIPDNKRAALGALLPTMSGSITEEPIKKTADQENQVVGLTGSFAAVGATGAFKPVGDELVRGVAPEDLYIDDADDSGFEENVTQTGAYAGPGYMDMPKERKHRFLDFFRRKNHDQEEEVSASAWLGVDESFDARQVGKARGSWESFQEGSDFEPGPMDGDLDAGDAAYDDYDYDYVDADDGFEDDFGEYGYGDEDRSWKGGAFSRVREAVAARGAFQGAAPEGDPDADAVLGDEGERESRDGRRARRRPQRDQEARQVAEFHGLGRVDVEVWFVALGSEGSGNGGMRAFMREHADELRGSIIVNIDSVGAGDLSIVSQEGAYVHKNIASRMKRYATKASRACGVSHGTVAMPWKESAAALAMKNRIMAMTVAGVEGGKPALLAQADDVLDAVDEGKLEDAATFVVALAQAI